VAISRKRRTTETRLLLNTVESDVQSAPKIQLYVSQAFVIFIIIIIIIYSLKIGAGQQGRIHGTYNCPQYKIKCRNIKYRE